MTETNQAIKSLIKAQTEMGKALKDTKNPFFKSKYADLTSVMAAVMPALSANGFAMIQPDGMDDRGVYVETIFMHESGEKFSTRIYLTIGKADMQGYGSAQTYARRYGLMGLAGIAPEDDDGNNAAQTPKQPVQTITADQFLELQAKIELAGVDVDKITKGYKIDSLEVMTQEDFPSAMHRLDLTIKKNEAAEPKGDLADDKDFLEGK